MASTACSATRHAARRSRRYHRCEGSRFVTIRSPAILQRRPAAAARSDRASTPEYGALLASGATIIDQSRNTSITIRELETFHPTRSDGRAR